jgi:conjugative relaxase-like TrwC/TraI family protein
MAQTVEPSDLHSLLRGELPDGTMLVDKTRCRQQQANAKATGKPAPTERAGLDLTASAPKSVSLQALVFGDRLLELAHQQANREMLRVLEERYAYTRITQDGKRMKVATGEVAIAIFHHDTSRALDPQIHTHNVILNLQRNPKTGRWQSLDNTEIYKAKMLLGQIYRNELACVVQDLGYSIHITNQRHGLWELEGFTSKQLRAFSTRISLGKPDDSPRQGGVRPE